jgi:hypothetical protein
LKTRRKRTLYLLLIVSAVVLAIVIAVSALLFHTPSSYKPLDLAHSKEVSLYLTHELLPELYNGAQYEEPFNLVVTQRGINDIVARFDWPQRLDGLSFSAPMVFFTPARLVLMGTVLIKGAEFVVTVIAEPSLDDEGLLSLQVVSVKLGAVDITPLAGVLAQRIYQRSVVSPARPEWPRSEPAYTEQGQSAEPNRRVEPQRFTAGRINTEDFWVKMTTSLLNGQPFDPVFKIEDKKVRVAKITLEQKKLTIRLAPVFD